MSTARAACCPTLARLNKMPRLGDMPAFKDALPRVGCSDHQAETAMVCVATLPCTRPRDARERNGEVSADGALDARYAPC
jgi:hypothetical protein